MTARRTGPRALIGVLVAAVVVLLGPLHAEAAFRSAATATLSAGSGTLAPPTAPVATKNCAILALGGAKLTTTWAASPSTYATGYTVTILRAGVVDSTNAVSGRTTVSAVYPMDYGVDYTFTVVAVYQNWTSAAPAAPATVQCGLFG
jgi:hypothetical protein